MGTLDIIIYAAIAAFLAFRLWSVLGQRGEGEDSAPRRNPFASKSEPKDNVIVLEGRTQAAIAPPILTKAGHAPTSLAGSLDQIKAFDESFEEKKFLDGAKKAFNGIVTAFAAGDLAPVNWLLGPQVEALFSGAIKERRAKGQTLENQVDRIVSADIVAATLEGSVVILSVEFVSHQINILRDESGEIIDGTPGKAEEVRDLWVFRRDIRSGNPNWQLIETRS